MVKEDLRVLFLHGLESTPRGSKVTFLKRHFRSVYAPDQQMSVFNPLKRNSIARMLLRQPAARCLLAGLLLWGASALADSGGGGSAGLAVSVVALLLVVAGCARIVPAARAALGDSVAACEAVAAAAIAEFEPDVLVASSWGGAIAALCCYRGAWAGPTLLLAPAPKAVATWLGGGTGHGHGARPYDWDALSRGVPVATAAQMLVVHGDADSTVPIEHSRELAARCGCRLKELPGGTHRMNDELLKPQGYNGHRLLRELVTELGFSLAAARAKGPSGVRGPARSASAARRPATAAAARPRTTESLLSLPLLKYSELPPHLRKEASSYILGSYRPLCPSASACAWLSLVTLHNETINTWSHLMGALFFLHLLAWPGGHVHTLAPAGSGEWWAMVTLCAGCALGMGSSAAYHGLCSLGEETNRTLLRLDHAGIVLSVCGCYVPGIYLGLACFRPLQLLYTGAVALLIAASLALQADRNFGSPGAPWQARRVALYTAVIAFGIVPTCHWSWRAGAGAADVRAFVPRIGQLYLFVGAAAAFFVSKWPECRYPGRFDRFFASHQLWHLLTCAAFISWYATCVELIRFREQNECPA